RRTGAAAPPAPARRSRRPSWPRGFRPPVRAAAPRAPRRPPAARRSDRSLTGFRAACPPVRVLGANPAYTAPGRVVPLRIVPHAGRILLRRAATVLARAPGWRRTAGGATMGPGALARQHHGWLHDHCARLSRRPGLQRDRVLAGRDRPPILVAQVPDDAVDARPAGLAQR